MTSSDLAGSAGLELAVVGGLAAGASVALAGAARIGRARTCTLSVGDPEVSRRHAEVRLGPDGVVILVDLGSRNGTAYEGHRVAGERVLAPGDVVRLGESLVAVRPAATDRAVLEPAPAGEDPARTGGPPAGAE